MAEFFEYDPITGIRTDTSYDEMTGEMTLHRSGDVETVMDFTKSMANDLGMNREGMKTGYWLYAKLPPIIILQMRAKGINVFDSNDQKKMFAEINEHYPFLKTTTGHEGARSSKQIYVPK
jgi:hypothetical protein